MKKALQDIIPKLSLNKHKGQDGRICIIGGSLEYTGAAYFAGKSILRSGADLVHIICDKQASIPIKSYCPELMVGPYLDCQQKNITNNLEIFINETLKRMHSIVIGPGLGRNENIMFATSKIINESIKYKKPLVLDGDGLWLISQTNYRDILINNNNNNNNSNNIILTPNAMEFRRLWINYILKKDVNSKLDKSDDKIYLPPFDTVDLFEKLIKNKQNDYDEQKSNNKNNSDDNALYENLKCDEILSCKDFDKIQHIKDTALLSSALGGITILRKGAIDIITNGDKFILIGKPYSLRRCGGQGDILAGIIGLWLYWTNIYYDNDKDNNNLKAITAAYAGSYLMRQLAVEAFNKYKRSTLTTDMIQCIPIVMDREFPIIISSL